jgi:outer membrane protein assembly factor BamE (lipoprotein component of BamABCDE complex)
MMMPKRVALMMGMILIGLLVANVFAAAPVITGQQLDKIVIGRTTKAQVISMFGPPQKTETVVDEEVLYYQTLKKDPLTNTDLCNVLTVAIGKNGKVQNLLYKKYCQR